MTFKCTSRVAVFSNLSKLGFKAKRNPCYYPSNKISLNKIIIMKMKKKIKIKIKIKIMIKIKIKIKI